MKNGDRKVRRPVVFHDPTKGTDEIIGEVSLPADVARDLAAKKLLVKVVAPTDFSLANITLEPDPWDGFLSDRDDTIRAFFKEAKELVKDELKEGDSVLPVILNKLRLLAEWRRLKAEGGEES